MEQASLPIEPPRTPPRRRSHLNRDQRLMVNTLHGAGHTPQWIANHLGFTLRQVRYVLGRPVTPKKRPGRPKKNAKNNETQDLQNRLHEVNNRLTKLQNGVQGSSDGTQNLRSDLQSVHSRPQDTHKVPQYTAHPPLKAHAHCHYQQQMNQVPMPVIYQIPEQSHHPMLPG